MFDHSKPTAAAAPARPEETIFEIDPYRSPFFRIRQDVGGTWLEVGFVWASGPSRTNSTEHWWLYDTTGQGDRDRAPYTWPALGAGSQLTLEAATPPAGQSVNTLRAYLETSFGVTLTHLKNNVSDGR